MKVVISGTPKEIDDLLHSVENRLNGVFASIVGARAINAAEAKINGYGEKALHPLEDLASE